MNFRNWFNKVVARAAGATVREEGQTMVEYGLILALISIAAIAVVLLIGPQLTTIFNNVLNGLKG
jgi:pilus assembly protein Flp/PilA